MYNKNSIFIIICNRVLKISPKTSLNSSLASLDNLLIKNTIKEKYIILIKYEISFEFFS